MTREEAKRHLEYLSVCSENHVTMAVNSRDRQAIEMAIRALEQPEQIHCCECKYYDTVECMGRNAFYGLKDDDYCSWAERQEEHETD